MILSSFAMMYFSRQCVHITSSLGGCIYFLLVDSNLFYFLDFVGIYRFMFNLFFLLDSLHLINVQILSFLPIQVQINVSCKYK
jgi:hypothetical protein